MTTPDPAQAEPVAWMYRHPTQEGFASLFRCTVSEGWTETPLYATPTRPDLAGIEGLVEAAKDCADELEAEVRYRWCGPDPEPHPANIRRLERDMEPVRRVRAILAALKEVDHD